MNSPNDSTPEPPRDLRRICPFLGQLDDPETSLAFPSEFNYCHCAVPPSVPALDYQISCCLTASFTQCPVYANKDKNPLPGEMKLHGTKAGGAGLLNLPLLRILGAIFIAVVVFLIGWFGVAGLAKTLNSGSMQKSNANIPNIPTLTPFGPISTHTLPHFPSLTPQPSDTPTETPTPPLVEIIVNTPKPQTSCGRPSGWVAYPVQSGDTLYQLSLAFGVTVTQLQNANCMGTSTILHVGKILYVPPWAMIPVVPTLEPTLYIPVDTPVETPMGGTEPTIEVPIEPATVPPATEAPVDTTNP
jgi:hypothetical protein